MSPQWGAARSERPRPHLAGLVVERIAGVGMTGDLVVSDPGRSILPADWRSRRWLRRLILVGALLVGAWILLVFLGGGARAVETSGSSPEQDAAQVAGGRPSEPETGGGAAPSSVPADETSGAGADSPASPAEPTSSGAATPAKAGPADADQPNSGTASVPPAKPASADSYGAPGDTASPTPASPPAHPPLEEGNGTPPP